jgi:alpha-beta hydrolase superfamily lysophospholipase
MKRCWRLVTGFSLGFAAPAAGQEAQPHTFRMVLGQDTIASEVVVRTPTRVDADLVFRLMGARWRYAMTLAPDGRVAAMTDGFYRLAQGDTVPFQSADLVFGPDSVRITVSGNESRVEAVAVPAGAIPYINPSSTMLEQVLRRARALDHPADTVPVFILAGGQTVPVEVTWAGADSAVLQFAGVEMRAAVGADGTLFGWTVPAQRARVIRLDGAHPLVTRKVDYGAPPGAPYTAEEVRVRTAAGLTLTGTLTLPAPRSEPVPAIVTITGSGPEDRDERLPLVEEYRPFWQIADTLARRGIATLRLDDRGVGGSDAGPPTATSADFADDVRAALAYLKTRPEVDTARLGLVGHSEGGLIAPLVAASDASLRGIVLMAGPAYTGRRILAFQQQNAVDKAPSLTAKERQEVLEQSAKATEDLAAKSAWLRYFLEYDPLATARKVRVPVLVLQGETDQQVTPEQADTLGAAFRAGGDRDVTVRRFPATNHLFLADPSGSPTGYSALRVRTVRPEVLGAVADWLVRHLR